MEYNHELEQKLDEFRKFTNYWRFDEFYIKDRVIKYSQRMPKADDLIGIMDQAMSNFNEAYTLSSNIYYAILDYYNTK